MRRLALLLLTLALLAACGEGQGSTSASPVGRQKTLKEGVNGKTVPVQPGDTLHFVLSPDLDWRVVEVPHMSELVDPPEDGRFVVHVNRAGSGMLKAVGSCTGSAQKCHGEQYSVEIRAYWIP